MAVPGLLFSDSDIVDCVPWPYVPRLPNTIPKYGTLAIVNICAANGLISLTIGTLKGANLGKSPDLV